MNPIELRGGARVLRYAEIGLMLLALGFQRRAAGRYEFYGLLAGRWFTRFSYVVLGIALLLCVRPIAFALPAWSAWLWAIALFWAVSLCFAFTLLSLFSCSKPFSTARRRFFRQTQAAICAAPLAITGFGILVRDEVGVREIDLPVSDLPRDLQGLRIVQISDIHLGPFLNERTLARVIDIANEGRAHVAVITGDLITGPKDPLDRCIQQITRLRSDAGVLGCLGNHERFSEAEDYAAAKCKEHGVLMLRDQATRLRFGKATLNVAGVDYQSKREPYLTRSASLVSRATLHTNLLLSHNPDVLPVAARQGFGAVLAGHTHGGQVNFEILSRQLNVAKFLTPYTYGIYREGGTSIYVTRGIGTVGIPARVGAPPEIAFIRLCAS